MAKRLQKSPVLLSSTERNPGVTAFDTETQRNRENKLFSLRALRLCVASIIAHPTKGHNIYIRPLRCGQKRSGFGRRTRGFTLLELQVTLVIMSVGLLSFAGLLAMQGRQMRSVEQWCRSSPTYYVVSQSNRSMRYLGAPAAAEETAGQSPWTPPVTGQKEYTLKYEWYTREFDSQEVSASVKINAID